MLQLPEPQSPTPVSFHPAWNGVGTRSPSHGLRGWSEAGLLLQGKTDAVVVGINQNEARESAQDDEKTRHQ